MAKNHMWSPRVCVSLEVSMHDLYKIKKGPITPVEDIAQQTIYFMQLCLRPSHSQISKVLSVNTTGQLDLGTHSWIIYNASAFLNIIVSTQIIFFFETLQFVKFTSCKECVLDGCVQL